MSHVRWDRVTSAKRRNGKSPIAVQLQRRSAMVCFI